LSVTLPSVLRTVRADKDAVTHVLLNLLHNAIKFSPQNSEVELSAAVQFGSVVLKVKDSGPGIPPEEIGQLFTPSYRGTLGKEISVGTGLGLHLCHKILQAHDGTITCTSRVREGSTFELSLPLFRMPTKQPSASSLEHCSNN
jgi:signal transduction histidine kinase